MSCQLPGRARALPLQNASGEPHQLRAEIPGNQRQSARDGRARSSCNSPAAVRISAIIAASDGASHAPVAYAGMVQVHTDGFADAAQGRSIERFFTRTAGCVMPCAGEAGWAAGCGLMKFWSFFAIPQNKTGRLYTHSGGHPRTQKRTPCSPRARGQIPHPHLCRRQVCSRLEQRKTTSHAVEPNSVRDRCSPDPDIGRGAVVELGFPTKSAGPLKARTQATGPRRHRLCHLHDPIRWAHETSQTRSALLTGARTGNANDRQRGCTTPR